MYIKSRYEMDDTCPPYNENESPYKRTREDDIFLIKLAEECKDTFDHESDLYKLQQELKNHEL